MTRRSNQTSNREAGIALIAVLWIVATGALLVATFNATARSGAIFMQSEVDITTTESVLDAGLEFAVAKLLELKDAKKITSDETEFGFSFANHAVQVSITDANALIDINKAQLTIIRNLILKKADEQKQALAVAKEIMKLRVEAAKASTKPKPKTEKSDQFTLESRNRDKKAKRSAKRRRTQQKLAFVDVTDLLRINGMTPQLFKAIEPFFTTYGRNGKINFQTASDEVLSLIPKITNADVDRFRLSPETDPGNSQESESPELKQAKKYLTNIAGPAFLVTVRAVRSKKQNAQTKTFVIVLYLDNEAPYRLISSRYVQSAKAR